MFISEDKKLVIIDVEDDPRPLGEYFSKFLKNGTYEAGSTIPCIYTHSYNLPEQLYRDASLILLRNYLDQQIIVLKNRIGFELTEIREKYMNFKLTLFPAVESIVLLNLDYSKRFQLLDL